MTRKSATFAIVCLGVCAAGGIASAAINRDQHMLRVGLAFGVAAVAFWVVTRG